MASDDIKSGSQVISDFLNSLQGDQGIDASTLTAVHELFEVDTLSRTRLLSALAALRTDAVAKSTNAAPDAHEPGDD